MNNPFFKNKGPFEINDILKLSGLKKIQNLKKTKIFNIANLDVAKSNEITFFHSKKYENVASNTKASFCITSEKLSKILPNTCKNIIVDNILLVTAKITELFYPNSVNDDLDSSLSIVVKTKFKNNPSTKASNQNSSGIFI